MDNCSLFNCSEETNSNSGFSNLTNDIKIINEILEKRNEKKRKSWFGNQKEKQYDSSNSQSINSPFQAISDILEKRNVKKKKSWFCGSNESISLKRELSPL